MSFYLSVFKPRLNVKPRVLTVIELYVLLLLLKRKFKSTGELSMV